MDENETLVSCIPEADRPTPQFPAEDRTSDSSSAPIAPSFFSGAMGLDLGLEQAGFGIRLAPDRDKDAAETIRMNRPSIPLIGDIHEYTAPQIRAAAGRREEKTNV